MTWHWRGLLPRSVFPLSSPRLRRVCTAVLLLPALQDALPAVKAIERRCERRRLWNRTRVRARDDSSRLNGGEAPPRLLNHCTHGVNTRIVQVRQPLHPRDSHDSPHS